MLNKNNKYYNWLILNNRKIRTAKRLVWTINNIENQTGKLDTDSFTSFITAKKARGASNSYLNSLIFGARTYTHYLKDIGAKYPGDIFNIKLFKKQVAEKATMSDEEIEAFLSLPAPVVTRYSKFGKKFTYSHDEKHYYNWTIFFTIMAYSGMRCGEVAALTTDDIDWGINCFVLKDTKTGIPRKVPIAPNIKRPLKRYTTLLDGKYLFPSRRGGVNDNYKKVVDDVDWHYNFKTRIQRLGIKRRNLTPYSLRHSFITNLLSEDANLFQVAEIAGHKDIRTTQHYYHLNTKHLQRAIIKHSLIKKHTDPKDILRGVKELIDSFDLENNDKFEYKLSITDSKLDLDVKIR